MRHNKILWVKAEGEWYAVGGESAGRVIEKIDIHEFTLSGDEYVHIIITLDNGDEIKIKTYTYVSYEPKNEEG